MSSIHIERVFFLALTFVSLCHNFSNGQTNVIAISQESAAGIGDFDENILGQVSVFKTALTAEQFYGWNEIDFSFQPPVDITTAIDQSTLFFVDTADGLALFHVHDRFPISSGGGNNASIDWIFFGQTAVFLVQDDPGLGDFYDGSGSSLLSAEYVWNSPFTDGVAMGPIEVGTEIFVSFSSFSGLSSFAATEPSGAILPLALQNNRRVRLQIVQQTLLGDVNQDGVVDLLDVAPFVELLTNLGFQAEADINQDGNVDLLDVTPFVDLVTGA